MELLGLSPRDRTILSSMKSKRLFCESSLTVNYACRMRRSPLIIISRMLPLRRPSSHPKPLNAERVTVEIMETATIVKLGGSIITDKSKECTPNLEAIYNAAEDLASYHRPLILLHGGGSYAHPIVRRARLQLGITTRFQLRQISETELHLDELTRIIGVSLLKSGKPFVAIRPMSFTILKRGEIVRHFIEPIVRALSLGLVPLIHGDLAFDVQKGCGVVSADRIASMLGVRLKLSRVLFGCDVDGVFTQDPKTSRNAKLIEEVSKKNYLRVLSALEKTPSSDATGSMLGKVREAIRLARHGQTSYIFNMGREHALRDALNGTLSRGTKFSPWHSRS